MNENILLIIPHPDWVQWLYKCAVKLNHTLPSIYSFLFIVYVKIKSSFFEKPTKYLNSMNLSQFGKTLLSQFFDNCFLESSGTF